MSEDIMVQVERLSKRLDIYAGNIVDATAKAIVSGGLDVEAQAKRNVNVNTGNLRRSINTSQLHKNKKGNLAVTVGPSAKYGAAVEFGTSPHTTDEGSEDFIASITLWGKRKGMNEHEIFELIDHIRKYGTKPHPYLLPAWYQLINEVRANIKNAVATAAKERP